MFLFLIDIPKNNFVTILAHTLGDDSNLFKCVGVGMLDCHLGQAKLESFYSTFTHL